MWKRRRVGRGARDRQAGAGSANNDGLGGDPGGFGTVTPAVLQELAGIVGSEYVRTQPGEREPYAIDATPLFRRRPDAVVLPGTTEEVAGIARIASEHRIPLVPRGSGTSLCGGTVPIHGGIVMPLTRMNRILEINESEMLAVVEPGVTTDRLVEAAAAHGLLYAPDPGSRVVCTVGGNVATNAGGLRGLKYGVTGRYMLGVEFVLASGEIIRAGGRLVKDVAGYDLTRLVVGSEGTLGVITRIVLGLLPSPAVTKTGVAYFADLAEASRAVEMTIAGGILPATLEFLDRTCIGVVEDYSGLGLRRDAGALLLFGDDGMPDVVDQHLERIAQVCVDVGALEVTMAASVAQSEELLAARRCTLPALSRLAPATILEDVTVPRPRLAEMVLAVEEITRRRGLLCGTFGHAGDGNLHPTIVIDPGDPAARAAADEAVHEIFGEAIRLGGTISGEHGIGVTKLPFLEQQLGPAHIALLQRVKKAFDPAGILNPGKLGS